MKQALIYSLKVWLTTILSATFVSLAIESLQYQKAIAPYWSHLFDLGYALMIGLLIGIPSWVLFGLLARLLTGKLMSITRKKGLLTIATIFLSLLPYLCWNSHLLTNVYYLRSISPWLITYTIMASVAVWYFDSKALNDLAANDHLLVSQLPKQGRLSPPMKWIGIAFLLWLVITCALSGQVDTIKCDYVNGGDHEPGHSRTKAEAIRRTTYICDVLLTYQPLDQMNPIKLKPLIGWVESSWRTGFWYLTTKKDTGKDITYRLTVNNPGDRRQWIVMNNKQNSYGYEVINYDYDFGCQFTAYIDSLPSNDTLRYTVLKQQITDEFKRDNIQGIMTVHFLKQEWRNGNMLPHPLKAYTTNRL